MLSEILTPFLNSPKECLLSLWRRRAFCREGELEATDDLVHYSIIGDESYDFHPALTFRAHEWIDLIDFADYLCPAFLMNKMRRFLNDGKMSGMLFGLVFFSSIQENNLDVEMNFFLFFRCRRPFFTLALAQSDAFG